MMNDRLNQSDAVGVDIFMVGEAVFNFHQSTITGEVYLSKPLKQSRKLIKSVRAPPTGPNGTTDGTDAVFIGRTPTDPHLYHKFEDIVLLRSGNLYSLYSQGNQDYQKNNLFLNFFIKKRSKSTMQKLYSYWS